MSAIGWILRSSLANTARRPKSWQPITTSRSIHQTAPYYAEQLSPSSQSQTLSKSSYQLPQSTIYTHTRPQPRAPVRTRPAVPIFKVNDDEAVLERMYERLFGPLGIHLTPELRWQAITHKSFDHGRQPYNDKLAFMGRRVLFYHANIHLINQIPHEQAGPEQVVVSPPDEQATRDKQLRTFSTHLSPVHLSSYRNLNNATYTAVGEVTSEENLVKLARMAGIQQVMRWIPRDPEDLIGSGQDSIAVEGLYAIIGAIALTRGGYFAAEFVQSRILDPLKLE